MAAPSCALSTCGKPNAGQRCPTCRELQIPAEVSHFCSKQCFQAAWPEHKEVHRRFKELVAASQMHECPWRSKFAGHDFTGALRPAPVSAQLRGVTGVGKPDYADDPEGRPFSELAERGRKFNIAKWTKPEDVAAMRRAGEIAREVTDLAARAIRPGVTGDQLDKIVHAACMERGVYPSPLNYSGFPKSVCVSVNEVICHGIPDARPLVDGDIVNLDVTVYYKGFHSDMNETYYVGSVDAGGRRLVACAYECLRAAIAMCKPGVFYCDLGDTITRIAKEAGFTVVKNYTGHGTGALFHTSPNIPHYAKNKAQGRMEVGHVFTIEPMINEGVAGDAMWPDDWTVVTKDGKRSAQFEHTMIVTETGVELLTARVGTERTAMCPWDEFYAQRPLAADAAAGAAAGGAASSSSSAPAAAGGGGSA